MSYCNKCGRSIPDTDVSAGFCEDCLDKETIWVRGKAYKHPLVQRKNYAMRDEAITFVIIFTLIGFGVFLLAKFMGS